MFRNGARHLTPMMRVGDTAPWLELATNTSGLPMDFFCSFAADPDVSPSVPPQKLLRLPEEVQRMVARKMFCTCLAPPPSCRVGHPSPHTFTIRRGVIEVDPAVMERAGFPCTPVPGGVRTAVPIHVATSTDTMTEQRMDVLTSFFAGQYRYFKRDLKPDDGLVRQQTPSSSLYSRRRRLVFEVVSSDDSDEDSASYVDHDEEDTDDDSGTTDDDSDGGDRRGIDDTTDPWWDAYTTRLMKEDHERRR